MLFAFDQTYLLCDIALHDFWMKSALLNLAFTSRIGVHQANMARALLTQMRHLCDAKSQTEGNKSDQNYKSAFVGVSPFFGIQNKLSKVQGYLLQD